MYLFRSTPLSQQPQPTSPTQFHPTPPHPYNPISLPHHSHVLPIQFQHTPRPTPLPCSSRDWTPYQNIGSSDFSLSSLLPHHPLPHIFNLVLLRGRPRNHSPKCRTILLLLKILNLCWKQISKWFPYSNWSRSWRHGDYTTVHTPARSALHSYRHLYPKAKCTSFVFRRYSHNFRFLGRRGWRSSWKGENLVKTRKDNKLVWAFSSPAGVWG